MSLRQDLLEFAYPIQPIYKWRFGFLLLLPEENNYFQLFYSKPFTRPLWNSLYIAAFIICIIFFLLQLWEKRVVGKVQENGITYEMLVVMGSYCQHIPPLHSALSSRRTAYFVFLIFSYVIYSFYTSNLLSHLVNDRKIVTDITTLSTNDFDFVIIDHAKFILEYYHPLPKGSLSALIKKLIGLESVTILDGLRKVKEGNCALLSDYITLNPYIRMEYKGSMKLES
ncbi:uncharacterized protein LOC115453586 [Manduca sexta]|uniref:uncharacterized protein LOC115453586 n=1 Tax=Manduca sexta TaxID=7130 RepID=UPI0018900702|nr:uncharacterized protein LOC115453586 [Manduca sexta]